jgi:hypothetical protein
MVFDGAGLDRPDVVAEVSAVFAAYEKALVDEDHEALDRWFWDDVRVVRFGIGEIQYGADAIAEWRRRMPPVGLDRTLRNTVVTSFGHNLAIVATEFSRPGSGSTGRQSQTWARLDDGWRIVHAHVSIVADAELEREGWPRAAS